MAQRRPARAADLDRSSSAIGGGVSWVDSAGTSGLSLNLDRIELDASTDLVLPGGGPGVSIYDLGLTSLHVHGFTEVGKLRLQANVGWIEDSGDTWPVSAWDAAGRVSMMGPHGLRYGVFVQYWEYDEDLAERDDFTATRYGLTVSWSFR